MSTNYAVFTDRAYSGKVYTCRYSSQPTLFAAETYCDFYKKKTLFILIQLTLKDNSKYNLTTTSI